MMAVTACTGNVRRWAAAAALLGSMLQAEAARAQQQPAEPTEATTPATATPQAPPASASESLWDAIHPSTMWYLSYAASRQDGQSVNRFHIGRGYVTLKYKPVKWFAPRVTLDAHQDDSGDFKVRLKYLYGKFILPFESDVLTDPNVELGMAHTPWFDYEEHINNYRAEGTMFIERNGVMNSADLGITVGGLLGEKLPKDYQKKVSKKYPGRYGSFALGLYNGGGYHAAEENDGKVFESRLSVRPLGFVFPNWQVSYLLIHGEGNTEAEPAWRMHTVMTSVEHEVFVLTAQLATGQGNQKGSQVDDDGEAHDLFGYSFFGELKLAVIQSSLIARFDRFDWGTDGGPWPTSRLIAGHAFHFLPHNYLMASIDHVSYDEPETPADRQAKLTFQLHYPPK